MMLDREIVKQGAGESTCWLEVVARSVEEVMKLQVGSGVLNPEDGGIVTYRSTDCIEQQ
jgi:hypothetical protein